MYTIERMFDLGAAAVIFSCALAFTPKDLPHHHEFVKAGEFSMAATLAIAVFAGTIRVAGGLSLDSQEGPLAYCRNLPGRA